MKDTKADMSEGDKAAWNAMLDGWRKELVRVGGEWGQMPASSAMLFVALKGLQGEVGNDALVQLLEGLAGKVRADLPITMKAEL